MRLAFVHTQLQRTHHCNSARAGMLLRVGSFTYVTRHHMQRQQQIPAFCFAAEYDPEGVALSKLAGAQGGHSGAAPTTCQAQPSSHCRHHQGELHASDTCNVVTHHRLLFAPGLDPTPWAATLATMHGLAPLYIALDVQGSDSHQKQVPTGTNCCAESSLLTLHMHVCSHD